MKSAPTAFTNENKTLSGSTCITSPEKRKSRILKIPSMRESSRGCFIALVTMPSADVKNKDLREDWKIERHDMPTSVAEGDE